MVIRPGGSPYTVSQGNSRETIGIFERLQFKLATANNGRRRAGGQQYYTLTMELYATLESGIQVTVASTDSCPLVVRGRSPNHYLDIDIPQRTNGQMNPIMPTPRSLESFLSPSTVMSMKNIAIKSMPPVTSVPFQMNGLTSPSMKHSLSSPPSEYKFNSMHSPMDPAKPFADVTPKSMQEYPFAETSPEQHLNFSFEHFGTENVDMSLKNLYTAPASTSFSFEKLYSDGYIADESAPFSFPTSAPETELSPTQIISAQWQASLSQFL